MTTSQHYNYIHKNGQNISLIEFKEIVSSCNYVEQGRQALKDAGWTIGESRNELIMFPVHFARAKGW